MQRNACIPSPLTPSLNSFLTPSLTPHKKNNYEERRLEVYYSDCGCHFDGNRNYAGRYQLHGVAYPQAPP